MTLLVFGMDGAVREYIDEGIERGVLPNIEKLREEGCFGDLKSTTPPTTIPAWVSMFSGREPGTLDVFHFMEMNDEYGIEYNNSTKYRGRMVWDKTDISFGLLNLPSTSPVWPIDGYMIEGFPLNENPDVYPESLKSSIPEIDLEPTDQRPTSKGKREGYKNNFRQRKKIFNAIDEDVDVRVEVFQLTDTVAHRTGDFDDIMEVYSMVDEVIGERMEQYEDFILVSDHGFQHIDQVFYPNTWLKRNGYLQEHKQESSKSIMSKLRGFLSPLAETPLRPVLKFGNDLVSTYTFVDFSPSADEDMDRIDFSRTEAFTFRGGSTGYADININDDRFKDGFVEDREKKAEEIKQELEKEEAVKKVVKREDEYLNPDSMPDIIVKMKEGVGTGKSLYPRVNFGTDAYIHGDTGIIGAKGPSFAEGDLEMNSIVDVAPTIASYFGESIECDGKVIEEIFSEDFAPKSSKSESEDVSGLDV